MTSQYQRQMSGLSAGHGHLNHSMANASASREHAELGGHVGTSGAPLSEDEVRGLFDWGT